MAGLAGRAIHSKDGKDYVIVLGYENSPAIAVCAEEGQSHPYLFIEQYQEGVSQTTVLMHSFKEAYREYKDKLREELDEDN